MDSNELNYYSRHLLLDEIGSEGQITLKNTSVLVVGAGGLGCPILQYLCAAGVGRIGIVDGDVIEASNLHRQILFSYNDLGKSKAEIACEKLRLLNPFIAIYCHNFYLVEENVKDIFFEYDIVVDGTDNFSSKYLINDYAYRLNIPVVFGSISQFDGQFAVFGNNYKGTPLSGTNLRDLYPEPPPSFLSESCSESGVLGVLPGIVGNFQALETIKLATNIRSFKSGVLHYFSGLNLSLDSFNISISDNYLHLADRIPDVDYSKYSSCESEIGIEIEILGLDELKSIDKGIFQIIDVRNHDEHSIFPVGEHCIPLHTLPNSLGMIDKKRKILFICKSGIRSKKAVEYAKNEFNLECMSIKGGIGEFAK